MVGYILALLIIVGCICLIVSDAMGVLFPLLLIGILVYAVGDVINDVMRK